MASVPNIPRNQVSLPQRETGRQQVPVLSREQRAAGRQKSLETRQARTLVKEKLRRGLISFRDAMNEDCVARMKLLDLLEAMPYIGRQRAMRILEELDIPAGNSVARCGPKQRAALAARFN